MVRRIPGGFHHIRYGTICIGFELIYSTRKTLGISVLPDRAVVVNAPEGTALERITETVQRRAGWIVKQHRHFESLERPYSPAREYVSGEAYRFLGRQIRLKVVESSVSRITRSRTVLTVENPTPQDRATVGQQVEHWFDAQAARVFAQRLEGCYLRIAYWGLPKPKTRRSSHESALG